MAASPVRLTPAPVSNHSYLRRPPLALTPRRLAANRRNASRSTGPRTPKGKARVARNAIKHGFFVGAERWTERQHGDFADTFAGLCEDFNPQCAEEEISVATIADSYVRMAALWRYENLAALRYHQQCERELNEALRSRIGPKRRVWKIAAINCAAPVYGGRPSRGPARRRRLSATRAASIGQFVARWQTSKASSACGVRHRRI